MTNLETESGKIWGDKARIPSLCMIGWAHYYTKYLYETERKIMTSDFSCQAPENITLCRVMKQVTVSDFNDLTLFCLKILGEGGGRGGERKTNERASVTCACGRSRKEFPDSKIPGFVWTGLYSLYHLLDKHVIILGSSGI